MEAVKAGAGRETAHEAIKEHAVATVRALRAGEISENDLVDRLAGDQRLGLTADRLSAIMEEAARAGGLAGAQVDGFVAEVVEVKARHPEAAAYRPGEIL